MEEKKFANPVIITDEVIKEIEDCIELAPLHNPAAILGIKACKKLAPNMKMVAVFDTAFHQTLEKKSYIYPIPYEYYEKYGVRKYGFHGTSHQFVANRVAELVVKDIKDLKIINCHLGQGASVCAIQYGKSVETSMGINTTWWNFYGNQKWRFRPISCYIYNEKRKFKTR